MTRHLLEVDDLGAGDVEAILALSEVKDPPAVLKGRGAALIFEKPSNRTRNATEMAVVQLGGHPVTVNAGEIGLGTRESVEDVARTLGCYHALICARVFEQATLERMAAAVDGEGMAVPVVNLLSDDGHPCQALADLLTMRQCLGPLQGRSVAYVGDGNNVARSLVLGAAMLGMHVRVATPAGYELDEATVDRARGFGVDVLTTVLAREAVEGADAVYTDVWASMGQEAEAESRRLAFEGMTVDESLMAAAGPESIFLHCLPAHRGQEVADAVLESDRSRVWKLAENRMHVMRGLFLFLLGVEP